MDDCIGCPKCGYARTFVTDSRKYEAENLRSLKRRRLCNGCGHKYNTMEVPFELALEIYSEDE